VPSTDAVEVEGVMGVACRVIDTIDRLLEPGGREGGDLTW
jgi:hypothetical protein